MLAEINDLGYRGVQTQSAIAACAAASLAMGTRNGLQLT